MPEKAVGLTLILGFFDRCAKPCSLYPPQAALAGFAANAGLACGLGHGAALTVHRTVIHSRAERFAFPP